MARSSRSRSRAPESKPKAARAPKAPRERGPRTFGQRLFRALMVLAAIGAVVGAIVAFAVYAHYSRGLPDFGRVDDYQPPQISRVYAADGTPIAEFFSERRTVVSRDEIPEVLVQAVLSAEDSDFFKHEGLDYLGMLRALYNSARAGRVTGSGSTITQQTVKNILLTQEKTFRRKAREIILTRRIESHLSKDEILTLYLNTIYLGHGRYGAQEAARFYYGKDVSQLDLNEAATLAGVIQSPERHSPRKHPDQAVRRRAYVLDQMVKNDFITQAQAERVKAADLGLRAPLSGVVDDARWFVEIVRSEVLKHVDENRLLTAGLAIQTTFDLRRQSAALAALRAGLRALDGRQGYDEPVERVTGAQVASWQARQRAALKDKPPPVGRAVPARVMRRTEEGFLLDLGIGRGILRAEAALRLHPEGKLEPGAVYPVELRDPPAEGDTPRRAVLANGPQGAMVVLDPQTRDVLALVGGWDYNDYPFDRASQAKRQPGSSFKPFIWGAAYASRRYSPASIMVDAPETWQLGQGKWWTPKNYSGKYVGPVSLRTALADSINSVAVKLTHDIGLDNVHAFAQAAGIRSPLVKNLSLALGSSEVTPLELANAFGTLANDGRFAEPRYLTVISDARGNVLYEAPRAGGDDPSAVAIDPRITWIVRDTMRSVVTDGSGRQLKDFPRPVVGKTGTSNQSVDTWFVGMLPDVVTVTWLGFDEPKTLGRKETGGRAAAPVAKAYFEMAERTGPEWSEAPAGVVRRQIDPSSGLLAPEGGEGRWEYFLDGTEPKETAVPKGQVDASNFMYDQLGGDEDAPFEAPPTPGVIDMAPRPAPRLEPTPEVAPRPAPLAPPPAGGRPAIGVPNVGRSDLPSSLRPLAPVAARPAAPRPAPAVEEGDDEEARRAPRPRPSPQQQGPGADRLYDEDRP